MPASMASGKSCAGWEPRRGWIVTVGCSVLRRRPIGSRKLIPEVKLPLLTETWALLSRSCHLLGSLAANVGGTLPDRIVGGYGPIPKPHGFLGLRGTLLHALLKSHPSVHLQSGASQQPQLRGDGPIPRIRPRWKGVRPSESVLNDFFGVKPIIDDEDYAFICGC
jgi:hypothetical protein